MSSVQGVIEPRWSYREAEKILGCSRITVSDVAKARGLEQPTGKPLTEAGLREIAGLLNVPLRHVRSA